MRLPGCSSDSESDDDYPEMKTSDETVLGAVNESYDNSSINAIMNINFRGIRRGMNIDCQDDDGNWYAAEVKKIDRRNKRLFISFINSGDIFDKWMVFNNRFARLHTYTYDNNSGNFKVGQMVEFVDSTSTGTGCATAMGGQQTGIWKKGIISAVSAETNRVQVTVNQTYDVTWINNPRYNIRAMSRNSNRNYRRWKIPTASSISWRNVGPSTSPRSESSKDRDNSHTRKISEFSDCYDHYIQSLEKANLHVVQVNGDGNCLFRAAAHQIYGDEELHHVVRKYCMDYMETDSVFFSQFVEGGEATFNQYLQAKRTSGCWGDDPEIQAISEIYDRSAEIFAYDPILGARKLRTFHEAASSTLESSRQSQAQFSSSVRDQSYRSAIKLSYYGGGHYDSIVDDFHRHNLISPTFVGKIEKAAILRCSQRVRTRGDMTGQLDEAKKLSQADSDANDRIALDLAIQISRHEHLGWATSEDIEACLQLALDNNSSSTGSHSIKSIDTKHLISPRQVYHSHASNLASQITQQYSADYINDTTSDLIAVQQDLIKTAAEQSEREYIENEILSSLNGFDDSKLTEEELLAQAKIASLKANCINEDKFLNIAIQKSLSEHKSSLTNRSNHNSENKNSLPFAGNHNLAVLQDLDDEAILQLAISESLQNPKSNCHSVTATSDSIPTNTEYYYHIDEVDEDLSRAIADSLKNLQ